MWKNAITLINSVRKRIQKIKNFLIHAFKCA